MTNTSLMIKKDVENLEIEINNFWKVFRDKEIEKYQRWNEEYAEDYKKQCMEKYGKKIERTSDEKEKKWLESQFKECMEYKLVPTFSILEIDNEIKIECEKHVMSYSFYIHHNIEDDIWRKIEEIIIKNNFVITSLDLDMEYGHRNCGISWIGRDREFLRKKDDEMKCRVNDHRHII